jgi:hypothetical protein
VTHHGRRCLHSERFGTHRTMQAVRAHD